jgi:hypothetical protein
MPTLLQGVECTVTFRVKIEAEHTAELWVVIQDAALAAVLSIPVMDVQGQIIELPPGEHTLRVPLGVMELNAGRYSFVIGVREVRLNTNLCRHQGIGPFRVHAERVHWAKLVRNSVSERVLDASQGDL